MTETRKNEELTLVVLAAGMASRFNKGAERKSLKQIEPVGPNGEFIIDYTIHDAIKAGFDKVVFIIREDIKDVFHETIGARVEPYIKVEYAYQDMKDVPEGVKIPEGRTKPLGTAHALWCARHLIHGKFAICSADDFYGADALQKAADHMRNSDDYAIIGYKLNETLSDSGTVKRGVCDLNGEYLNRMIESEIVKDEKTGIITCNPLDGSESFIAGPNTYASMLLNTADTRIFETIRKQMPMEFCEENLDKLDTESLLPNTIDIMMNNREIKVKNVPTISKWYGITNRADLDPFKKSIDYLIEGGVYQKDLYSDLKKNNNVKRYKKEK